MYKKGLIILNIIIYTIFIITLSFIFSNNEMYIKVQIFIKFMAQINAKCNRFC